MMGSASDDCGRGSCWCGGGDDGPVPRDTDSSLDQTPATGVCDDDRRLVDGYWYCMVEDGLRQEHGIIVD